MKKYTCEECGILLKWKEILYVKDSHGREHAVCVDCATDKYHAMGPDLRLA